jgi:hypothetical protein
MIVIRAAQALQGIGKGARPALPALREAMALEGEWAKGAIEEAIAAIEAAR